MAAYVVTVSLAAMYSERQYLGHTCPQAVLASVLLRSVEGVDTRGDRGLTALDIAAHWGWTHAVAACCADSGREKGADRSYWSAEMVIGVWVIVG